jgi:hypothetical protein
MGTKTATKTAAWLWHAAVVVGGLKLPSSTIQYSTAGALGRIEPTWSKRTDGRKSFKALWRGPSRSNSTFFMLAMEMKRRRQLVAVVETRPRPGGVLCRVATAVRRASPVGNASPQSATSPKSRATFLNLSFCSTSRVRGAVVPMGSSSAMRRTLTLASDHRVDSKDLTRGPTRRRTYIIRFQLWHIEEAKVMMGVEKEMPRRRKMREVLRRRCREGQRMSFL